MKNKSKEELIKVDEMKVDPNKVIKTEPKLIKENFLKEELILGATTKTGKQLYKYIDSEGNEKEVLPGTAKKNGYTPLKNE